MKTFNLLGLFLVFLWGHESVYASFPFDRGDVSGLTRLPQPRPRLEDPDFYERLPCFKALNNEDQAFLKAKASALSTNDDERFDVLHKFSVMLYDPEMGIGFIKAYLTPSLEKLCGNNSKTMSALVGLSNLRNEEKRRHVVSVLEPYLVQACLSPFSVMTLITDLGFIKDPSNRENTVRYLTTYFAKFMTHSVELCDIDVHNTVNLIAGFPPKWFQRDPTPFLTPTLTRHCRYAFERAKLVNAFFEAQDTPGSNPLDYLTEDLVQTCLKLVPAQCGTEALVKLIGYLHKCAPTLGGLINLSYVLEIEEETPLYTHSKFSSPDKRQE